jgi:hypothetical protein
VSVGVRNSKPLTQGTQRDTREVFYLFLLDLFIRGNPWLIFSF